jgi:hypothetical protein
MGRKVPGAKDPLALGSRTLFQEPVATLAQDPALHALLHLQDTLAELADQPHPEEPVPPRELPSTMPA